MRIRPFLPLLILAFANGMAFAQAPAAPARATIAPLPALEPTSTAPPVRLAEPPPAPVTSALTPQDPSQPPTPAPVIVEKPSSGVGEKLGVTAGGLALGAAGAAVAGPVGKIAGGLIGKTLAKGLIGKDDGIPEVRTLTPATPAPTAPRS